MFPFALYCWIFSRLAALTSVTYSHRNKEVYCGCTVLCYRPISSDVSLTNFVFAAHRHGQPSAVPSRTVGLHIRRNWVGSSWCRKCGCAKLACSPSRFILAFLYAASSIQIASQQFVWSVQLCSVNFAVRPTAQKEIGINEEIYNVKVKVTSEQATKAQWGSRDMALLFL